MKKFLLSITLVLILTICCLTIRYLVPSTGQTLEKQDHLLGSQDRFIKGVNDCGPQTLRIICEIFGVKSTVEELARLAGTDETGTTMGGLYEAAEKKGLDPLGENFTIQKLEELKHPAIAFVRNNHFVVVESFVDGKLRILDPPNLPYQITQHEFTDIWGGHALVFGLNRDAVSSYSDPSIVFDSAYYHFGRVPQNQRISHNFTFRNLGLKPLEVSIESSSCQCTAALMSERRVPPGQAGEVGITYTPKKSNSETTVKETVILRTNDPRRPLTILTVTGKIYPTVKVMPPALNFKELSMDTITDRKLTVVSPNAKVLKLETNSPDIVARIMDRHKGRTYISVSVKPSTPPYNSKLFIYTDDMNSPKIEVPIAYEIAAPVTVIPKRVFFGVVKATEDNVNNVNVSKGNMTGELKIKHIESSSPFVSFKLLATKTKDNYNLQISIGSEAPAGALKDTITVHTNQMVIPIPVYAVVMK